MKREEIPALVAIIATIWPNAPQYRDEHAEAFLWILEDCDAEDVKRALSVYIKEDHAFPPNAGQLYARCQEITNPLPDASTAWAEVLGWVHGHGSYDPPTQDSFSHPAVYLAISRVGYHDLCMSSTRDSEIWFSHFRRAFDGALKDVQLAPARALHAAKDLENPFALERGAGAA